MNTTRPRDSNVIHVLVYAPNRMHFIHLLRVKHGDLLFFIHWTDNVGISVMISQHDMRISVSAGLWMKYWWWFASRSIYWQHKEAAHCLVWKRGRSEWQRLSQKKFTLSSDFEALENFLKIFSSVIRVAWRKNQTKIRHFDLPRFHTW